MKSTDLEFGRRGMGSGVLWPAVAENVSSLFGEGGFLEEVQSKFEE